MSFDLCPLPRAAAIAALTLAWSVAPAHAQAPAAAAATPVAAPVAATVAAPAAVAPAAAAALPAAATGVAAKAGAHLPLPHGCRPDAAAVTLQNAKVRWEISPCMGGAQSVVLLDGQFSLAARKAPPNVPPWAASKFAAGGLDLVETWDARWDPFREVVVKATAAGAVRARANGEELAADVAAYGGKDPLWAVVERDDRHVTLVWPDPARIDSPLYLAKTWRLAAAEQPYALQLSVQVWHPGAGKAEVQLAHDLTTFQHQTVESGGLLGMFGAPPDLKGAALQVGEDTLHVDSHSLAGTKLEDRSRLGTPAWFGVESRYFMLAAAPAQGFAADNETTLLQAPSGVIVSRLRLAPMTLADGSQGCVPSWLPASGRPVCAADAKPAHRQELRYDLYAGPKDHDHLAAFGHHLVKGIDFGWFGFIALPMLFVLRFGHDLTGSWPLAILLLTVLVKALLWPVTAKSMRSMKNMAKLKPELDKVRADLEARAKKLGKAVDPQEINKATFELYKQHGVNPVGGCLPLLLQMPVYIALYRSINASVSLFNQPLFGWIGDMTQKDPYYVLPLVLGAVMFVQQKITPQAGGDPAQQKVMLYFMPILFTLMMLGLPSGLTLYILINTLLSVAQTMAMQRSDGSAPLAPTKA